jgi:TRAP transporter TAXI family solute receptor
MSPKNLLQTAVERLFGPVAWDHVTSLKSVDLWKFESILLGKHLALILFCLGTFFGLMIVNPYWALVWGWLVDGLVAPALLLIASLTFSFAVSHVVRARGGTARRQLLLGLASFAAAMTLSSVLLADRKIPTKVVELKKMEHLSIFTGKAGQSYFNFGQEVTNLAAQKYDVAIKTVPTRGSIENLHRLQGDRDLQSVALVQDDVLKQNQNEKTGSLFREIIRLPHPEEVHIVTLQASPIKTLQDLEGRRVAMGERDSGTRFTARLILGGLKADEDEIGPETGLQRLRLATSDPQRVDAVFYVVRQAAEMFNSADFKAKQFKFVEIPLTNFLKLFYAEAFLTSHYYKWLEGQSVATISVGTILVAHKNTNSRYVDFIRKLIEDNKSRLFVSPAVVPVEPPA